jgi:hypothetical protein
VAADFGLCRQQFGNADQVVADQVKQKIGSDGDDAAVLGFAHRAVLFAPAEEKAGRPEGDRFINFQLLACLRDRRRTVISYASTNVADAFLFGRLGLGLWLRRKLQHGCRWPSHRRVSNTVRPSGNSSAS